jgi:hypothetical protein
MEDTLIPLYDYAESVCVSFGGYYTGPQNMPYMRYGSCLKIAGDPTGEIVCTEGRGRGRARERPLKIAGDPTGEIVCTERRGRGRARARPSRLVETQQERLYVLKGGEGEGGP